MLNLLSPLLFGAPPACPETAAGGGGRGDAFVRKEVPLTIAPAGSSAGARMSDFAAVQALLLKEEQQAHEQRRAAGAAARFAGGALAAAGAGAAQASWGRAWLPHSPSVALLMLTPLPRPSIPRSSSGGARAQSGPAWFLLARIHDAGVHQASLCELAEASIAPALSAMRLLAAQVELQKRQLDEECKRLQGRVEEIQGGSNAAGVAAATRGVSLLDV
jgi:hypothetical protein